MTVIPLTEDDIVIDNSWTFSKGGGILIECGKHNENKAKELKQQILSDHETVKLVKSIDWNQVGINHYSKKNQLIIDKLVKLQSILEGKEK